ncbi:Alg9-like mannosyltransferase family-domain-containing protein [Radiomyces spectabilis]|uniref:Alg9-like mannosyltransferase family-domain-containing protein n=1 Tax=Radiomyces spectabilis TaxID=64574 RepID=UPI00221FEB0A|nr:Alg9-like mannosyltransferase family-domain-containing protein [Radiomyces spectabilis]KAI8367633.1 Alg9-like mannosyltransferase family-domain-containing protein [Radiomyces spectabilis]
MVSFRAAQDLLSESGTFSFSLKTAFRVLLIMRCASALYSVIQDCDEVFNYWEPTHYLLQGYGLQTWEYAPQFGLRSWAYILIHALIGFFTKIFTSTKLQTFYLIRMALAAFSSFAEAKFYRTVVEEINPHVGRYILVTLFFSAGMFSAATALLPSSFAMSTVFMAFSYILRPPSHVDRSRTYYAVFWIGLGALLGWPFSAILGLPFAIEEVVVYGRDTTIDKEGKVIQVIRSTHWRFKRAFRLLEAILVCGTGISLPILFIDHWFYRNWSFTPLNMVMYNLFGGEARGPSLYGTEPWYFYIVNGFLNFNIMFLLALGSVFCVLITAYIDRQRVPGASRMDAVWPYILLGLKLVPFYIWFTIFTCQPHKEERFLYVAYPLITLNAAISLYLIRSWASRVARAFGANVNVRAYVLQYTSLAFLAVFALISVSRILAVVLRYRAPVSVYGALWQDRAPDQIVNLNYLQEDFPYNVSLKEKNLCVGKEWYRFPSSFFLPSDVRLQFIQSDFNGQLPKPFQEDLIEVTYDRAGGKKETWRKRPLRFKGTSAKATGFNDLNVADPSVYVSTFALGMVSVDQCDYLVDTDFPLRATTPNEPRYVDDTKTWEILDCQPFLDAENSKRLSRAFWVPGAKGLAWGEYCLLKRRP